MMLAIAGVVEWGLQILLPVFLVRVLTGDEFGDYRLVWLIAMTGQAVFTFFMPQSLFYLLPRADVSEQRRIIGNTTIFLIFAGVVAGGLLVLAMPYLSPAVQGLQRYSMAAPIFLSLWIAASLCDTLPTADGRAELQAIATVVLAVVRALLLGLVAIVTRDISTILWAMCFFVLIKLGVTQLYVYWVKGFRSLSADTVLLNAQISYAFPFAIANGFFLLKLQADQWVVASSFPPAVFALISIATVALSISTIIRNPVNNALLPKFNLLFRDGDMVQARVLLAKSYAGVAFVLVPTLGLFFVAATEIVELVYTSLYFGAAPIMQIYLAGQVTGVFAAGHLLASVNLGKQSAIASSAALALSVVLSVLGVKLFGVNGAAAGSVVSLFVTEIWALVVVARTLGTSPFKIIHWDFSGKVVAVVLVAVAVVLLAKEMRLGSMNTVVRLVAESFLYMVSVIVGMVMIGIHRHGLSIARDLLRRRN
jgi:O-antigen/teichoic acid export membrane protein